MMEAKTKHRTITPVDEQRKQATLDLVEQVFTEHENATEGALVRRLVQEIRAKEFFVPELELMMTDEGGSPIGYACFSRFHLGGKFSDRLLLLSPVAVKTELQRQHISKELIELGFARAAAMGFTAVIVEGNPQNYRSRGFVTSRGYGITAAESVNLPAPECLMVKELVPGGLDGITGVVEYSMYECLR